MLYETVDPDYVARDPVLVMGMEGWIDASLGAATAMATLLSGMETRVVGTFDADELLDFRARRPTMRIVDGVNTALHWPEIHLRAATDAAGHDVLLLIGPEPDHKWKEFTATVVEVAQNHGVRIAVGLGSFPAPVPHTRPIRLSSTATNQELAALVGFTQGSLEVPSGVHGALERGFAHAGTPAIGLWARTPNYIAAMPYPASSLALLRGLRNVAGVEVDVSELAQAAEAAREQVDRMIEQNPEHVAHVRRLEARHDASDENELSVGDLPSGDELAAELERFLREHRPD